MKRRTVAISSAASRKGWRTRKQMKKSRLPSLTQRLQILRIINLKDTLPNPFLEINNET